MAYTMPMQLFTDPKPFCANKSHLGREYYETPTTCFEALDPTKPEDLEIAVLYAEGVAKVVEEVYPTEIQSLMEAFMSYDEPLHPVPVGASVFYFVLIAWVTTFYFTYLGRKLLANMKQKLDLHPQPNKFPNLPLYWLQQSKREADLRREVRNTWAWLAKRYLLSPNDPLLANVDQILGTINWHDFEVSRNTWSLIKCVLRLNALFIKVRRNKEKGDKSFELLRDTDLTKVPMEGDKVRRVFEEVVEKDNSGLKVPKKENFIEKDGNQDDLKLFQVNKTRRSGSSDKLQPYHPPTTQLKHPHHLKHHGQKHHIVKIKKSSGKLGVTNTTETVHGKPGQGRHGANSSRTYHGPSHHKTAHHHKKSLKKVSHHEQGENDVKEGLNADALPFADGEVQDEQTNGVSLDQLLGLEESQLPDDAEKYTDNK